VDSEELPEAGYLDRSSCRASAKDDAETPPAPFGDPVDMDEQLDELEEKWGDKYGAMVR
jgi:hypothetical protein